MAARTAEDRAFAEFVPRPDARLVIGDGRVTVEAWIPTSAAFEFYRDDIQRRIPMAATRLRIDLDSVNLASVNNSHE